MSKRKYDAVLFDLGNTLVSYYAAVEFQPVLRQCVTSISKVLQRSGSELDLETTFSLAKELNVEHQDGQVWPLEDRLRKLITIDKHIQSKKMMGELVTAFLNPIFDTGVLDPEALSTLSQVKSLGFKTAIVSNTPWDSPSENWNKELDRWGLLEAVDETVFCVDVGWRKPASPIFERTLSLLNVKASRTIFIGDVCN